MKFKWYDIGVVPATLGALLDKGQRKDWWKHSLVGLGTGAAIAAPFVAPALLGAGGAAAAGAGAGAGAAGAGAAGGAAAGAGAAGGAAAIGGAGAGAAGGGASFMKALSAMGPMLSSFGKQGGQSPPQDAMSQQLMPLSPVPTSGPLSGASQRQGSIPTSDELLMNALMRGRRWGQY